jgi:hypothetical protein
MLEKQRALIPSHGSVATAYRLFYLIHKIIVMFYVPITAAFLSTPTRGSVAFDFYLDFVFLIEIITQFFMPFVNKEHRFEVKHSKIAYRYLTTWFIFEVLALLPFSLIRLQSEHMPNSKDDWKNLTELNFKSLPRSYPMMLMTKYVRIRKLFEYLLFILQ